MESDADMLARLQSMIREQRSLVRLVSEPDAAAIRWAVKRLAELEGALDWYRDRDSEAMRGCKGISRCDCNGCVKARELLDVRELPEPRESAKEER